MAATTTERSVDPGLAQIDALERDMVLAYDQKAWSGVSAEELARFRSSAVAQAKAICDQLRADYRARNQS